MTASAAAFRWLTTVRIAQVIVEGIEVYVNIETCLLMLGRWLVFGEDKNRSHIPRVTLRYPGYHSYLRCLYKCRPYPLRNCLADRHRRIQCCIRLGCRMADAETIDVKNSTLGREDSPVCCNGYGNSPNAGCHGRYAKRYQDAYRREGR